MPELPELAKMAAVVNRVAGKLFNKARGSEVWTKDRIPAEDWSEWPQKPWLLSARSRGKELLLTIKSEGLVVEDQKPQELLVRFNMGMSGTIRWEARQKKEEVDAVKASSESEDAEQEEDTVQRQYKHAHLEFEAADGTGWLVFVDPRRFGRITWAPEGWSADRSPCPMTEYEEFCQNIVDNVSTLKKSTRAVADVIHDQKYFNGIGNYLRAEILHRVGVGPMVPFFTALRHCEPSRSEDDAEGEIAITSANRLLLACRDLCREVIELREVDESERQPADYIGGRPFEEWLQVYGKDTSKKLQIGGQTFWFVGSKTKRLQSGESPEGEEEEEEQRKEVKEEEEEAAAKEEKKSSARKTSAKRDTTTRRSQRSSKKQRV